MDIAVRNVGLLKMESLLDDYKEDPDQAVKDHEGDYMDWGPMPFFFFDSVGGGYESRVSACLGDWDNYYMDNAVGFMANPFLKQQEEWEDDEKIAALDYINWVINASPWASVTVEDNAEHVFEYGAMYELHHPSRMVAASVAALRWLGDHRSMVQLWNELVMKQGQDRMSVFMMSLFADYNSRDLPEPVLRMASHYANDHSPISNPYFNTTTLRNIYYGITDQGEDGYDVPLNEECVVAPKNLIWSKVKDHPKGSHYKPVIPQIPWDRHRGPVTPGRPVWMLDWDIYWLPIHTNVQTLIQEVIDGDESEET